VHAQYFVTNQKGEWKIRVGYRYTGCYASKRDAVRAAIDFAERDGQAGRDPQVLIQGEDRLFRAAWIYGRDPYPIEPREGRNARTTSGTAAESG